ncbi:dTDP-4-dehydrorhamnose reductase [Rickettsia endosymbiont of Halotydeus destructor]|uniref:dTDP-4-dehydrorhamnose reductase n=1 Tax=Rickettsia endosymbiont of Halotydeus destructor TaxID=2996754 RepID=UPI003BAFA850
MKILLFGKNGQVSRRLYITLLPLGKVIAYCSEDVDFRDGNKLRACVKYHNPDIIVNAAAYTAVDKAETDQDNAFLINAEAVRILAEEANKLNAWLIHFSTDYVFDGTKKTSYNEQDEVNPLSIYGKSKAKGDAYIQDIAKNYLILRVSWVYDSYGTSFPKKILSLAKQNKPLKIINDQFGSPNNAIFIANITCLILYRILTTKENARFIGLYNLSTIGRTSWFEFAKFLVSQANLIDSDFKFDVSGLQPVSSAEYLTPAPRPANSVLDVSKLEESFNLKMPKWDIYIPKFIEEINMMNLI